MEVIALDTGILPHASQRRFPHHRYAYPILQRLHEIEFIGCITEQVLFEYYNVMTRLRIKPVDVLEEIDAYKKVTATIHPKNDTYLRCLAQAKSLRAIQGAQIYDLFLAQTAVDNNIDTLLTFNVRHFRRFKLPLKILDTKKF